MNDTYSVLRTFADSWMLLVLVLVFVGVVVWVFRPGSRKIHDDTAEIPFRHEDKPAGKRPSSSEKVERRIDRETGIETTGHSWDGIEELNNPLPRWWLWTFYATVLWSIVYVIAFPAIPMVNRATGGLLGWSTRGQVAEELAAAQAAHADLRQALVSVDLDAIPANDELDRYAVQAGAAVFRSNCSQCHGSGAAGAVGYPNLLDDDWLWGGTLAEIAHTVRHGVRNEDDPDARYSEMPAFGEILSEAEIDALVEYVLSISGHEHDEALTGEGEAMFLDNCAACHSDDGSGMRDVGAPSLTDAIWLYGGEPEAIRETITHSRFGVMPAWGERLGEANVRAVAIYVYQLGGGEEAAPPEPAAENPPSALAPPAADEAPAQD